ncbi:MAG: PDZ domain-containing protein, partial [Deltaproteobacteria bacterium]
MLLVLLSIFSLSCSENGREDFKPIERPKDKKARKTPPVHGRVNFPAGQVRVLLVPPGTTAARAGFKPGDALVSADGKKITSEQQVERITASAGGEIEFEVVSGGGLYMKTLPPGTPGWLLLSGATFRTSLIAASQRRPRARANEISAVRALELFEYSSGRRRRAFSFQGPALCLFFTIREGKDKEALSAFARGCPGHGAKCMAVDTLELATAVRRPERWQRELEKAAAMLREKAALFVDHLQAAANALGIRNTPVVIAIDAAGRPIRRLEGSRCTDAEAISEQAVRVG